jgi:3-hydroxyisobutyrate dehydrogenase-like beta-hydroxyacid dehydrogenase
MRVAFLGLGIMGQRMAANLVKAGHDVAVWNRTPGKQVAGARMAETPGEAAVGMEAVWICVSDTAAVERILFGEGGLEPVLAPGMMVVDSSTISPSATLRFAERVHARGADYADAPMTGSKIAAEAGTLTFMVGASEDLIARLQPLFDALGKIIIRVGDTGKGQAAKLALNLQIALIYEGFAEGLTLAAKLGVPPEKIVELAKASMVRSGVLDYKVPFVLGHDYTPNFPLKLMYKDIRLMLEAAKENRVKLPALETVGEIYSVAEEEGLGDLDYAATLELLEKWAGLAVAKTTV